MAQETDDPPRTQRRAFIRPPRFIFMIGHLGGNAAIVMASLLFIASIWLASANLREARKSAAFARQSHGEQTVLDSLLSTLKDAETGQSGYLLTGNVRYLEAYTAAASHLPAELSRLKAEPKTGGQGRRMARIRGLAMAKMAELDRTVDLAKAGHRQAALNLVRTDRGKQIMDALRAEIDGLKPGGNAELQQSRARWAWPRAAVVLLGVLSSALLTGMALGQRRERRAAMVSLASLKRFTSAFGASQGLLRTLGGTITFWTRGMERLYGFTAREAIGRRSDDLFDTQFPAPREQIQAKLERDGHWEGDVIKHRRDGSEVEVATLLSLHRGDEGEADDVIVLDNDISERRRAERADEQSSTLLRTIVETAPGPIYAKDREGFMLLANAGALQLIGKPWIEIQGLVDIDLFNNRAQVESHTSDDRRIMEAGWVEETEEAIADDDGVLRVWLSTKTPFRNSSGQVSGLVSVSVEVTELKLRATALAKLNTELNCALAACDLALQQRDALLREVYHRVKNNLQIIDGFIVMQARQMEEPGAKTALLGLRNRIHALALVHHQLMHSKNLKTFDIAPFLKELASNIVDGGAKDGIKLSVSAIPLEVDLDFAIPMGLLVAELVTNSIKHAFPDGKGTITVSLECAAGGEIALIVSDDGQGRTAGNAMSGLSRSGLGTSIINGLVSQLDGEQIMEDSIGTRTEIRVPAPLQL